jgi:hypothetical protein
MYKREDFEIVGNYGRKYIELKNNTSKYLFKDSVVRYWQHALDEFGSKKANKLAWFDSQTEAERTLNKFLRRQNMNEVDVKIEQCKNDIETLQKELTNLEKQKEEKKFYLGDKFTVINNNTVYMLVKVSDTPKKAALVVIDSKNKLSIGNTWKHGTIDFYYEDGKYFTTKLPTVYPQDFGLDSRYGIGW